MVLPKKIPQFNAFSTRKLPDIILFLSKYFSDLSDLQISILDPQGKILQQKKQVMYSGINQIKIHTNELVQGIYFVKIQQSGKTKTVKFVKQ